MVENPAQSTERARFRVGQWLVDTQLDEISRVEGIVKLEPRMMRLLMRLAEKPGQVVSTEQLLDSVWSGVVVGPASVYQAVSQLRKLLGDTDPVPTYIATVPRKGYRLVAAVEQVHGQARPSVVTSTSDRPPRWWAWAFVASFVIVVAVAAALWLRPWSVVQPAQTATTPPPPLIRNENRNGVVLMPFESPRSGSDTDFANLVTLLFRDRLANVYFVRVIANNSAMRIAARHLTTNEIGEKLQVRYLLRGSLERAGSGLVIKSELVDTLSGQKVWSGSHSGALSQLAAIREDFVREVSGALPGKYVPDATPQPIDLDSYALFTQGQRLLDSQKPQDVVKARSLFEHAIVLNPKFARGHLGLGQALVQMERLTNPMLPRSYKAAVASFDAAVKLDPSLGQAWYGKALCNAANPRVAEDLFQKASELQLNDGLGLSYYSEYLRLNDRYDESDHFIDEVLLIDPLSAAFYMQKAELKMRDRAEYWRLAQLALDADPDFEPARYVVSGKLYRSGEFAQAIKLVDQPGTSNSSLQPFRPLLTPVYLDVGDPDAAFSASREYHDEFVADVILALYRHDVAAAATAARRCDPKNCTLWEFVSGLGSPFAAAVRDQAMVTGDYASALRLLQPIYTAPGKTRHYTTLPFDKRHLGIICAHLLLLDGKTREGTALARSLLELINAENSRGPSEHWLARDRAAIYALLGDDAGALGELEAAQRNNLITSWWYTFELDPIFKRLHGNPRFEALAANARKHSAAQRALLDDMRKRGEVRLRPAPGPTAKLQREARS